MSKEESLRALGSISAWMGDKVSSVQYGLVQVEIVVQDGRISRVDKIVKEQIKI